MFWLISVVMSIDHAIGLTVFAVEKLWSYFREEKQRFENSII